MIYFLQANYYSRLKGSMVTLYRIKTSMECQSRKGKNLIFNKTVCKAVKDLERHQLKKILFKKIIRCLRRVFMEIGGKKLLIQKIKHIKPLKNRRRIQEVQILSPKTKHYLKILSMREHRGNFLSKLNSISERRFEYFP